jgi:hypothetical protein
MCVFAFFGVLRGLYVTNGIDDLTLEAVLTLPMGKTVLCAYIVRLSNLDRAALSPDLFTVKMRACSTEDKAFRNTNSTR